MIARSLVLALLLAASVRADVALYTVINNVEAAAVSPVNFGNIAQGDTQTIRFRMRNNSAAAAIQVSILEASGTGFALNGQPPIPFVLAPGAAQDFNVTFTASTSGSFSGNLQVNTVSLILLASASSAPVLTVLPPCIGTPASAGAAFFETVNFGQIAAGQSQFCSFQLENQATAAETVATFTVAGAGFTASGSPGAPLTLEPQQNSTFGITFAAAQPGAYTGTLTIASRVYQLTAAAYAPPLSAPVFTFDTTLVNSGEQHTLSMRLPSPSPLAASGNVALTFQPDSPVVADDPAIVFAATGTRTLPFSVKANSTQVLIGGAGGAVFQTGTSSGVITFTVSGVAQGLTGSPSAQLRVPPATIAVDAATFTARPGNLDIQITGFDNTYSAGKMAFTFYDGGGNAVAPGTIEADFSAQFGSYFSTSSSGSMFLIGVTFPVSGSELGIATANVTLTNAAGISSVSKLAVASTLTVN